MPTKHLSDAALIELFHEGVSDKDIAAEFGITVQAVSKRRLQLHLPRKSTAQKVAASLRVRWKLRNTQDADSHSRKYANMRLREWLRYRYGDKDLSEDQIRLAKGWVRERMEQQDVLCYNPDLEEPFYYRARRPEDGRLLIDWPADLPFPSTRFKQALQIPLEPPSQD
jgi:transcriptional regulator with XRE-family HTH domain